MCIAVLRLLALPLVIALNFAAAVGILFVGIFVVWPASFAMIVFVGLAITGLVSCCCCPHYHEHHHHHHDEKSPLTA